VKDSVSATGYTSVFLVMNMQRFIADADLQRFAQRQFNRHGRQRGRA